ncbi:MULTISPECIES: hypothetical protein [Rhodomicrobium]|uniref:hypothetical protein n=1 Tax=Rhodomicrobium TaxID=1068 RepID=UPI000F741374|nr:MULTISPECIES: hypothetical protein [Rhodomicrobium]
MLTAFRAAAFAVLLSVAAVYPAAAQQEPAQSSSNDDGYKPPARFIAKEPAAGQKPVAAVKPGAAKPATPPAAAPASVKTIGLISVLGDTFTVKRVGIMVFGNEEHKIPIGAWKINDQVAALVTKTLKKTFKVKPIRLPDGAYEKFESGSFIFTSRTDELGKFIAGHAGSQPCDYYLVVGPAGDRVGGTNQSVSGLGVLRREMLSEDLEFVHAYVSLQVYDSKFQPVRGEHNLNITFNPFEPDLLRGPNVEMKAGNRLPPDPKAAVADPRTRKIITELLEPSLVKVLPQLFAAN